MLNGSSHLVVEELHDFLLPYLVVLITAVCSNRKTRRNRHTDQVHLGKVRTFASERLSHLGITFSLTVTEGINSFLTHSLIKLVFKIFNKKC